MCRFLAYLTRWPRSVQELLGPDGLPGFLAMAPQNRDGWGMGWYDEHGRARTEKSTRMASEDPLFARVASVPLGSAGIVHMRAATPGLLVEPRNTHPFRHANLLMAHNGAIYPQSRLDKLLPPGYQSRLAGTTDSEHYFMAVLAGIEEGLPVPEAICRAVGRIAATFAPSSLNALLLTPTALYAVSWHEPSRVPPNAYSGPPEQYFDLRYEARPDAVIVASSGWPQHAWEVLPNHHALVVDRRTLAVDRFGLPVPPGPALDTLPPLPGEQAHASSP